MARMRPVIGCFANGAEDFITNGKDGVLVNPRDIGELAAALEKLIADPEYCRVLGEAGRSTAEGYSWDTNAKKMLALLNTESEPHR
jgi:teichuronic acid biosynthesis glycosyltransferase TuaC